MRLAKEGGEIGGEYVDELLPLLAVLVLQPIELVVKTAMPGLAQATRHTAVRHGLLAAVQMDACALVNQGADSP